MGAAGFEQTQFSRNKAYLTDSDGAKSGAVAGYPQELGAELVYVASRWSALSPALRSAMLGMVQSEKAGG